jgi:hypothetical protein
MPLTMPTTKPTNTEWSIVSNARTFTSPLTGAIQTAQRSGNRWSVTLTYENLFEAERAVMQGFLAQLTATANNFFLEDHSYSRRADGTGTPLVNGASQTGNTLTTDGWSGTYAMRIGDFFEVNGELKMSTTDAAITAGAATLSFVPELREAPADNAAITITNPKGVFRLTSPVTTWSNRSPRISSFSFECVEDVLA